MQISFDWEYEPCSVKNCRKAKQYVCKDLDLVFTFFPIDEFDEVANNALYLQGRNGVYMAIGADTMYTGLSESNDGGIMARFRNHLSGKTKKEFIENVVMVTSVRENPEDFTSEVIRSLEHVLYLMSSYANRLTVFNSKGKTDYKITGRRQLKQFLKIYGTVCEMLNERNVDCYFPNTYKLDDIIAPDVFKVSDETAKYSAAVRVIGTKLVILKNSRFLIPNRCMFDFESYSNLFINLIDKAHACIVYDQGEFYFTFIEDFTCSTDYKFEDISNLITDVSEKAPKKLWRSTKGDVTLEKYEEKKWK
jgi:hypothetical protein